MKELTRGSFGCIFLLWDELNEKSLALKIQDDIAQITDEKKAIKSISAIFEKNKQLFPSIDYDPFPEVVS